MIRRLGAALAGLLFSAAAAAAQTTCPTFTYGAVLTAGQWQACFDAKQNALGYVPVNKAGDVMLGKLTMTPSALTGAGINLSPGVDPASPNNGDLWVTSSGLFVRINGATIGPLAGAGAGTFAATAPVAVSFPAGIVTYALNFNSTLAVSASNLGINLAHSNVWTALQAVSLNAGTLPTAIAGTVVRAANADATTSRIVAEGYGAIAALTIARADGTAASPTQVLSGDQVGGFNAFAWGSNGAWNGTIASVRVYAAENISGTGWGSKLCLATTPSGTTTNTDSLCQQNSGGVTVGSPTGGDQGAGTINATGLYVNGVAAVAGGITALTGDGTATGPGSVALTLATVNSNVGSFGSSTAIPTITVNGKGLITAVTTNAVVAPAGTLTGTTLASNVVTTSITTVGTLVGGATGSGFTVALGTSTITGQLGAANGGSGVNAPTAHAVLVGEGSSPFGQIAIGTAGRMFLDQGAGVDPAFAAMSGDATLAGSGALTIGANKVTYAKFQQSSAGAVLLGVPGGVAANYSEVTLDATLTFSGTTLKAVNVGDASGGVPSANFGVFKADGTTITCTSGTCSAVGAVASSIDAGGATSITSGTDGRVLSQQSSKVAELASLTQSSTAVTVVSASLVMSGNISAAAWTTNGIRYVGSPATLTDTTSSGTVATAYTSVHGGNTIAASSVVTYTNYFGAYFNAPTAGANVTLTNKWALGADSAKIGTSNQVTISTAGLVTVPGTINVSGTFQFGGNAMTFPGSAATLAALDVTGQTITGGALVTSLSVSTGSYTVVCGNRPIQYIANTGAFTVTAPASDSACYLQIENGAGAGAVTFSGFTGASFGDALDTTNGHKFVVSVWRIHSVASYLVKALQ